MLEQGIGIRTGNLPSRSTFIIYIDSYGSRFSSHPDDVLAGGDGQAHQAGAVDGHDAVPDAEGPAALCRAPVQQVGHHHRGQDGAPAGLHHRQTQDLPWALGDQDLRESPGTQTDGELKCIFKAFSLFPYLLHILTGFFQSLKLF